MEIGDETIESSHIVSKMMDSMPQINMAGVLSHTCSWIINSGATEHITCSDRNLIDILTTPSESSVKIPNGESVPVHAIGSLYLPNGLYLRRVLYIPKFQCSLLSASRLTSDLNCTLTFFSDFCTLQDIPSRKLIGVGKFCNGLYYMDFPICEGVAMSVSVTSELWHQRLGHASDGKLHHISFLKGFRRSDNFCDPCIRAKQTRLPFSSSSIKTTRCFELIHCDIWGGYRCDSIFGARLWPIHDERTWRHFFRIATNEYEGVAHLRGSFSDPATKFDVPRNSRRGRPIINIWSEEQPPNVSKLRISRYEDCQKRLRQMVLDVGDEEMLHRGIFHYEDEDEGGSDEDDDADE
ncbi:unnamed protein product, partial [Cuscuta epithymum]